jgi:cytochrome c oxidase subunit 3
MSADHHAIAHDPVAEREAEKRFLAHHFDTLDQQASAAKLGMWLFLATEILMFSGLFLAYFIIRMLYPEMVLEAHEHLSKIAGGVNTIVLLLSSVTAALAVRAAQVNDQGALKLNLWITMGCAATFMVVKAFEYTEKFAHGFLPGKFYSGGAHGYDIEGYPHIFFGVYFVMTGLHGFHVLIGMGVLGWVLAKAYRGEFGPRNYMVVENFALYWHLVDLIWIFLFPLLYLVR